MCIASRVVILHAGENSYIDIGIVELRIVGIL